MSPIEIPEPAIPLPLDGIFTGPMIQTIGNYAATVWELVNQNSFITVVFILLVIAGLIPILYNLVAHRGSAVIEEEG
jgi:hypothetical protein